MTKPQSKINTPPPPGSQVFPFRLGDRVRDKINGLEGTAIVRLFHISGCDTFIIERDANKEKMERGEIADNNGDRLELVTARPELHKNEIPDVGIFLGDEARDLVHGIAGVVTHIIVPLYGAVQIQICPKYDEKDKKLPESYVVDAHHVEVTKALNPIPKTAAPKPAAPQERGASPVARNFRV